ncbi:F5/8_type C domain-containing protein [Hexamita inflata]|uniref:F5/8_type C domain-containing protein n=1 Tax=Hexamita inflata TaxID=28002 RepID=A0ABP1J050_9EUKA
MSEEIPKVNVEKNVFTFSKDLKYVTRNVSDFRAKNKSKASANDDSKFGACQSYLDSPGFWAPRDGCKVAGQYIEFDFKEKIIVGRIVTQGSENCWVSYYRIESFVDGQWCKVQELPGNTDGDTKLVNYTSIIAEKLRIYPLQFNSSIRLRVDVAVCNDASEENVDRVYRENKTAEKEANAAELEIKYQMLSEKLNKQMSQKYKNSVQTHKVSVNSVSDYDQIQLCQFKNQYMCQLTTDGNFEIYCSDYQKVINQIVDINPVLKATHEEYRSLYINKDNELEELGFVSDFQVSKLKVYDCQKVKFNQNCGATIVEAGNCGLSQYRINGVENWLQLRELYLPGNYLVEKLVLPSNVQKLTVSYNQIIFAEKFAELNNLTELCLSNNLINNIESLAKLKNLTFLNLQQNEISNIEALSYITTLTHLNLTCNKITNINSLAELTDLKHLAIARNDISNIEALSELNNLTELIMYCNQITNINALSKLNSLVLLDLSYNQCDNVEQLSGLKNLTYLNLQQNKLTNIDALIKLINLKYLNLAHNNLNDIESLSALTNLTGLYLGNNSITNIKALSMLKNLMYLSLEENKITNIEILADHINLQRLKLASNLISNIDALSRLLLLNHLDLSYNQIFNIDVLAGLNRLLTLHLSSNQISQIDQLAKLINLKQLRLNDNKISSIEGIAEMNKLEYLWLGYNVISNINPLKNINQLRELFLEFNQIENVDVLHYQSGYMIELNLRGNKIQNIQPLHTKYLSRLDLRQNYIKDFSMLQNDENFRNYQLDEQK